MEKHVVVIYPHPDDESFGAGGTITKYRKEGVPVTYLCGTLGEMGRNMGNPTFANRETLPDIRQKELIDACNVLDIDVHMMGYRDKTIEFEDRNQVARHIKQYLDDIQPSLVITHYPGHAVHPDHDAYGAAAVGAVRLMDKQKRPTVWTQAITRTHYDDIGKPDVSIDITDYFDRKMEAIMAHKSQASGIISQFHTENAAAEADLLSEARKHLGTHEEFYVWVFDD
ncbi:MAG TPA: bacillithiol biosynthesis deacetylase BshB2 [Bacillota bacterium]|nr:bacillithiol biosynthesis deacetylase BshB2 [Bacillota bacterium]